MNATFVLAAVAIGVVAGCNAERKQECDQFLGDMKPLESGTPSAESVARIQASIAAIQFQDEPLREYASNAKSTLQVLASSLETQATPTAPDGTDDLVKAKLKEALGERNDVARYCAQ